MEQINISEQHSKTQRREKLIKVKLDTHKVHKVKLRLAGMASNVSHKIKTVNLMVAL